MFQLSRAFVGIVFKNHLVFLCKISKFKILYGQAESYVKEALKKRLLNNIYVAMCIMCCKVFLKKDGEKKRK